MESRKRAQNVQIWAPIWCAASVVFPMRAATEAATVNVMKNAAVRSVRSRAAENCTRMRWPDGRSGAPLRARMTRNTRPDAAWAVTFAIADPRMPIPAPNTSAADRAMLARLATPITTSGVRVSWSARIHPWAAAVTRTNGAPSDAIRIHSRAWAAAGVLPPAIAWIAGACHQLEAKREHHSEPEREPGGLDADVEGLVDAAGTVQPRGPRRGAVLEEGAEPEDLREQQPRERQARERHGAEMADDGRVAQNVERLGDQRAEGRDGERKHLAIGRHPRRSAHARSLAGAAGPCGR